ncbi:shikimate kinase AroL [Desulfovibrio sp. SGI.169]|uniref:shikimate kinase AroL n=1 Tax=Desulfovibrio sp. SGI.169 TaxID=3420561 RepID=UPI003D024ACD
MAAIFLVGARAAGKTTVGLELARLLDCPFTDTDQHLCRRLGRTVAEVVADEGWPGFRARESEALREVTGSPASDRKVVATGGGMVLDPANRSFMRERGTVFYLAAPAEALARRLRRDPLAAQRPSLTGLDMVEEVRQVLAERHPLYEEAAHHILDATAQPAEICAAALRLLGMPPSRA